MEAGRRAKLVESGLACGMVIGLTASAVLGLARGLPSSIGELMSERGLSCGEATLIDATLPLRECPARTVDILLDVSEEIMERGRGMNSRSSAKTTRGRGTDDGALSRRLGEDGGVVKLSTLGRDWDPGSALEVSPVKGFCSLTSEGVDGALLGPCLAIALALINEDISDPEMAPERRCECPRRPAGGPRPETGGGGGGGTG